MHRNIGISASDKKVRPPFELEAPRYNQCHLPYGCEQPVHADNFAIPGATVSDKTICVGAGLESDLNPITESHSAPPSCCVRSDESDCSTNSEIQRSKRRGFMRHTSFDHLDLKTENRNATYERHLRIPSVHNLFGFEADSYGLPARSTTSTLATSTSWVISITEDYGLVVSVRHRDKKCYAMKIERRPGGKRYEHFVYMDIFCFLDPDADPQIPRLYIECEVHQRLCLVLERVGPSLSEIATAMRVG
jgi:hypothetical protein